MNAIRERTHHKKIRAIMLAPAMLLTGMLITAWSSVPASAATTTASSTEATYIHQAQGYVEVLTLFTALSPNSTIVVTGRLYDAYNCGNGQEGATPFITVSGNTDYFYYALNFSGVTGTFNGQIFQQFGPPAGGSGLQPGPITSGTEDFVLTDPSGVTTTFQLATQNSLSYAVSQEPAVSCVEYAQTTVP